jgi:predicted peptidase
MNKRLLTICLVLFLLTVTTSVSSAYMPPVIFDYFEERTFQFTAGKYQDAEIKYRLHVPATIRPGRRYPLVVHLHGIGEAGACNRRSLLYLDSLLPVLTGSQRQDFFMLVVQCPSETPGWFFRPSTQDGTLDVLVAAIEHVVEENPIDTNRITATGVSSGGWGVWQLIMEHPNKFAGAVPTACGAPSPSPRLATLTQTPVWSIINRGDVNPESILTAKRVINEAGGSMRLSQANVPGHNAWVPAMENFNSVQWMLAQRRGSWFSPPPGVIVYRPHSTFLVPFIYILPFAIIVVMAWGTLCKWTSMAYQSAWEWVSKI